MNFKETLKKLVFVFFLFSYIFMFSQSPNDCVNSVIVCGNSSINVDVEGIGTQELSGSNTCQSQENNSVWLVITIETSGTLGFVLTPNSTDIGEDYDFFIFGPNRSCSNLGQAIRCSTTNPSASSQGNNLTGMNASETDTSEGPGADGNSFVSQLNVSSGENYFVVIDRPIGMSPFSLEWTGTATFPSNPVSEIDIDDLIIETCDNTIPFDDNISEFDLSDLRDNIIGNQQNVSVSFHSSESDSNLNIDPLGNNYTNQNNQQIIFARIEDTSSGCFIVSEITLNVIDNVDFNAPTNFNVCDDTLDGDNTNGEATFDFLIKTEEIVGNFNPLSYNISYHESLLEAENNNNPLPILLSTSAIIPIEIFTRIENTNTGCVNFSSFFITVNPIPEANNATIFQCDLIGPQDEITTFNLNEFYNDVTGETADRIITFFNSITDAETNTNPINPVGYSNISNPETLIVKVTNSLTDCSNIAEITLEVSATAANDTILITCDTDGVEDGLTDFDLSLAESDILLGLPAGLTLSYFETLESALLETNPIPNNYRNTTAFNQTIFVRVENNNNCYGINKVELQVLGLPNVETEFETLYCLNTFPEKIVLTGGVIDDIPNNYYYNWSTGETTKEIEVNEPGVYTVTVRSVLGCTKERTITVLASNTATITNIEVTDASQNNTITILTTGEGDYEFALDNPNGQYQESNVFDNVLPGIYTVYARDKNNCGITEEMVSVIGFPKFFTPNGDNQNDFWEVKGVSSQFQPNTKILIFDKYGKLIAQVDPIGSGWDGNYNGNPMPSSDYWFTVTLEDGRQFSNHFTLKR